LNAKSGIRSSGRKKGHVDFPPQESTREFRRGLTRDNDVYVGQLVAQEPYGFREPVHLGSCQEAHDERGLGRVSGSSRRFAGRLDLRQRQPRVIEKCPARGRQLDPAGAAYQKLDADFQLQGADLPAQRRLRRMQPPLGRERKASFLGDGDKVPQMPQLHVFGPCLRSMALTL
jgi:hypothetical protein